MAEVCKIREWVRRAVRSLDQTSDTTVVTYVVLAAIASTSALFLLKRPRATSAGGTNAKCRRALNLSAFRGIPEVMAHVQKLGRHFKTKP